MMGVSVSFTYDGNFDRARIEKVAADSRSMFEGMRRVAREGIHDR